MDGFFGYEAELWFLIIQLIGNQLLDMIWCQ